MNTKREDDRFLRRVIWFMGTLVLASSGGWIWTVAVTQAQVDANTRAVGKINELHETMTDIRIGVAKLVTNSEVRNKMMQRQGIKQDAFEKKQLYIFGEQKQRTQTIIDAKAHIKDWRIHQ